MDQISWVVVYPEIALLVMTCVIALADITLHASARPLTFVLTLLTLAGVALLQAVYATQGQVLYGFGTMVVSDPMGNWLKCFAALAVMLALIYGRNYSKQRQMLRGGELYTLALFSLLGMFVMIGGHNFLVLYMGLELLTLSSYAMVALRRDNVRASEAAMKYFVLGAMASGFLLYGLSMLYGATGSLDLAEVAARLGRTDVDHRVLALGVVFVVAGLAFKLGAAPFHSWVPDVYDGAPTAVTLLIAAAPKLAAFAIVMRLLVGGMLPMVADWQQMVTVLAVASLVVGNFAAIAQSSFKRMLAYSTISQMGFVLLGLAGGVMGDDSSNAANAYSATMFYVVTYVLTTLATFGVMLVMSREGFEAEQISDFAGLNRRSALLAGIVAACMFSLAGVPPLVGFYAKLSVLQALLASGNEMLLWVAIAAVMLSLIGAFPYLRLIKVMYFDKPTDGLPVGGPAYARRVLSLNVLLMLGLGLLPGGLMALCAQSIARLLA
jgi:NADH-quinone oxidoreductase subunit N